MLFYLLKNQSKSVPVNRINTFFEINSCIFQNKRAWGGKWPRQLHICTAFSMAGLAEGSSGLLLLSVRRDSLFWLNYLQKLGFTKACGCKGEKTVMLGVFLSAVPKVTSGRLVAMRNLPTYRWTFQTLYTHVRMKVKKGNYLVNILKGSRGPQGSSGHTLSTAELLKKNDTLSDRKFLVDSQQRRARAGSFLAVCAWTGHFAFSMPQFSHL